ncbi:3-keto-disaccharide hydrolase [Maribacter stanieri]|uniref:3-keto-alpha-glucoside-1,2-lyase/3-keto-2-hydroxy-glucal hydratase domain-containing protein n=1 Tax=Maribacter stanieri TaxID=440514 RepID=A0A1I6IKT4_9FLAO|nr:DUF1080 domain-containing protein [Maribacter stanieri]SFR66910.1 protein of unknown function [Maribacter stanieri]
MKIAFLKIGLVLLLLLGLSSCKQKEGSKDNANTELTEVSEESGFIEIFDGKTLSNWKGDPTYWSVQNGNLVGEVTPETLLKSNTFIIWQGGQPDDFELKLEFKIATSGNSGINYRSELLDTIPNALKGYQADIDGKMRYTGQNYEEKKRATLAYRGENVIINTQNNSNEPESLRANVKKNCWQSREVIGSLGDSDSLKLNIKSDDWNEAHLIIKGNKLQHYINGVLMSEVTDNDTVNRKLKGYLGVQVHVGPPMKVEYRNIRLKNL